MAYNSDGLILVRNMGINSQELTMMVNINLNSAFVFLQVWLLFDFAEHDLVSVKDEILFWIVECAWLCTGYTDNLMLDEFLKMIRQPTSAINFSIEF